MIIITAVGSDRPGMAHAVAKVLFESGCNIEDTTMTRLSGEFAMILIVTPPVDVTPEVLSARLAPLESSHGLFINCRAVPEEEKSTLSEDAAPRYIVSVYGAEKPGLLARITEVLAAHGANITDLQTRVASAGTVYVMVFEIELPPNMEADDLSAALQTAGSEIGVQVSLRAMEEDTL